MNQPELFHESFNDALKEVVRALGGTKKVAAQLKPEKSLDDASRWLSDCLNPDRREKLDQDQILWLFIEGRKIGCHAAMAYVGTEAGYKVEPVEPEDERGRLMREYIEATKAMGRIASQMERVNQIKSVA